MLVARDTSGPVRIARLKCFPMCAVRAAARFVSGVDVLNVAAKVVATSCCSCLVGAVAGWRILELWLLQRFSLTCGRGERELTLWAVAHEPEPSSTNKYTALSSRIAGFTCFSILMWIQ